MVKKIMIVVILGIFLKGLVFAQPVKERNQIDRGVWVSVFSRALHSKEDVLTLIETCKKMQINQIYLQLYQSGRAYYDSEVADNAKYKEMIKAAGIDTISFLLKEAKKNKIKVFAWLNILSLGKNDKADILLKFKDSILTMDQYLKPARGMRDEFDKYYLPEDQIFLEPGDLRVLEYYLLIIDEILGKYPQVGGIHFDYIRYPAIVPFVWGSRFNKFGLTYGYGKENIRRFKEETGLDPLNNQFKNDDYLIWDNYKRRQVTHLVEKLSSYIKNKSPEFLVSCAVIPGVERAYVSYFQDWPFWLENGIVDYVVLMNYTRDDALAMQITKAGLSLRAKAKVFIGLGVFLMKNEPERFLKQYGSILALKPDGIVFFSYDELRNCFQSNRKLGY
ncbi:MAG: family 10 glycosylhydrolase [Candidatus Omnitrophota bacterium]|nr:family 10 glycosylhydrolase [Candidatus Omnitrophota bacterium]